MGNSFGNFQSGVGQVSAEVNMIGSYIICGIFVLIAIVIAVFAIKPMSGTDFSSRQPCGPKSGFQPPYQPCQVDETCDQNTNLCMNTDTTKKPHYGLLIISAILLIIGIGSIFISKAILQGTKKSKAFSQVYGTYEEANMVKNLFQR